MAMYSNCADVALRYSLTHPPPSPSVPRRQPTSWQHRQVDQSPVWHLTVRWLVDCCRACRDILSISCCNCTATMAPISAGARRAIV